VPELVGRDSTKARLFQAVSRRAASRIITGSEHSKRDICRHLGVAAGRVEVIHDAADESFHVVEDRTLVDTAIRRYGIDAPYLLYIGGFDRRKNVDALIRAYAQTTARHDATLVLVGASEQESARLHATAESAALENRVRIIGYVPDDDLVLLYNGASAFVYPSLYEGFGLPAVEAMACGTPVLTSNRASLPEVVGDAALIFDPTRLDDIAAAIDRVFTDGDEMSRLRSRGLAVAARLTWRKTAERTLDVYRSALGTTGQS
jgi:glycosyltransferase involved in cell wall biosynthesis